MKARLASLFLQVEQRLDVRRKTSCFEACLLGRTGPHASDLFRSRLGSSMDFLWSPIPIRGCPRQFGLVSILRTAVSCPVKAAGSSSARLGTRAPLWNRLCYAC